MNRLRWRATFAAVLFAVGLFACGGSSSPAPGTPAPTPPSTNQSPCATSAAVEAELPAEAVLPAEAGSYGVKGGAKAGADVLHDGNPRWRVLDDLWIHRAEQARRAGRAPAPRQGLAAGVAAADVGDVAVLQDEGDLFLPPNTFDLARHGLRFTPTARRLRRRKIDGTFRTALGTRVTLSDDDSVAFRRCRSRSRSTAGRSRRRSSTPTATSPSRKRTSRAPSATSRAC